MPEEVRAFLSFMLGLTYKVATDPVNLAMGVADRKGVIPLDAISNLRRGDCIQHL